MLNAIVHSTKDGFIFLFFVFSLCIARGLPQGVFFFFMVHVFNYIYMWKAMLFDKELRLCHVILEGEALPIVQELFIRKNPHNLFIIKGKNIITPWVGTQIFFKSLSFFFFDNLLLE